MIAAKPSAIPYLSALLPSELELQTLEETDSSEQDDQTDTENNSSNVSQASMKHLSLSKCLCKNMKCLSKIFFFCKLTRVCVCVCAITKFCVKLYFAYKCIL